MVPPGEDNMYIMGANANVEFAYYFKKIGLTITAGFRCQYLYYKQKAREDFTQDYDLFYGPNITIVYTF
jgi:hypothetical protein